jgi:hypothetical protein
MKFKKKHIGNQYCIKKQYMVCVWDNDTLFFLSFFLFTLKRVVIPASKNSNSDMICPYSWKVLHPPENKTKEVIIFLGY